MSRWIRGIYNAAANFNLSNALRATSVGRVGRDQQHLSESSDEPNQHVEPSKSCQSGQSSEYGGTCHRNRATPCSDGDHCYADVCGRTGRINSKHPNNTDGNDFNTVIIGNDVVITVNRECNTTADYIEREYAEYTATIRAQGQGNSTGVRVSDEPRDFKHSNNATGTNVEHVTGIPTGVTI